MKVNLGVTKVMVCGSITKDGMSKCKVDPCEVCSLSIMVNSVLCLHCGKWIHGGCARVKRVAPKFSRNLYAENVNGIFVRQWSRAKNYVIKPKQ